MDKNINLQHVSTKYDIDKDEGCIRCWKKIILSIFDEKKFFHGFGMAFCTKENKFNISFGEALAEIRAQQDLFKQIEVSMIKYTFDHFVEKPKKSKTLESLEKLANLIGTIEEAIK